MSAGVSKTSFNVCGRSQNCVGCYIGYPASVIYWLWHRIMWTIRQSVEVGQKVRRKETENVPLQPSKSWSHNGDLVLVHQVETMMLCLWENCFAETRQPVGSARTYAPERCGLS